MQRAVREVAEDHRLTDAVGPDQDDVLALGDEAQREEVLDLRPVDPLRPRPVEVAQRLEGSDPREVGAVHQTSARALFALDGDHALEPRLAADLVDTGRASVQSQLIQRLQQRIKRRCHRRLPSPFAAGRSSRARACVRTGARARASDVTGTDIGGGSPAS